MVVGTNENDILDGNGSNTNDISDSLVTGMKDACDTDAQFTFLKLFVQVYGATTKLGPETT